MQEEKMISFQLFDRHYQIKCHEDEAKALKEASDYLITKINESKTNLASAGADRIVIMTALNLAYELLNLKKEKEIYLETMNKRIVDLQKKIENALIQYGTNHV